jgi:hypothetical protein
MLARNDVVFERVNRTIQDECFEGKLPKEEIIVEQLKTILLITTMIVYTNLSTY